MKKYFALLILLFSAGHLFPATIPVEKASIVAQNWYFERGQISKSAVFIKNYFVETKGPDTLFYIFNVTSKGFVIVSAEDAVVPVLAYGFAHNYTTENHPPGFDIMLTNWKEQILYIKKNKLKSAKQNSTEWNRLSTPSIHFAKQKYGKDVFPLLTTIWAQGNPYYSQCPTIGGQHCLVGCVAVAMAQVMKYHNHPSMGTGFNSYFQSDLDDTTVYADFNTTYDWANMSNTLSGADSTQINAVAKLLFHVGVSVEMGYGLGGSGASISTCRTALKSYFFYDTSIHLISKDDYPDSAWEDIMRTELDNNRPVIYRGAPSEGASGHAFILDGYQGTNYFHFNWGWSGSYNDYFYLDDLTPSTRDYTYSQRAIIGIRPYVPAPDIAVSPDTLMFTWEQSKKETLPSSNSDTPTELPDFTFPITYLIYDTVKTITIKNNGDAELNVTGITKSHPWIVSVNPANFTVTPMDSQDIIVTVTCDGLGDGTYYGSLNIVSDDPDDSSYLEPVKFVIIRVAAEDTSINVGGFTISYSSNPAMGYAHIAYSTPYSMNVSIKLYDMTGRLVQTLENKTLPKGIYKKIIDAGFTGTGVYFCRVEAGNLESTKKLILVK